MKKPELKIKELKKKQKKTSYAGEITLQWSQISNIQTDHPVQIVLGDKTSLNSITQTAEEGKVKLKMGEIVETVSFELGAVKAINPSGKSPAVKLTGHVNVGVNITKGNSDTSEHHLEAEIIARTETNRFTAGTEYNRSEVEDEKTVDNALSWRLPKFAFL